MSGFDPYDWNSYYFGSLDREEACKILMPCPVGSFLVRESNSRPGGFSLSVREAFEGEHQIHHYFVEKKETNEGLKFEMSGHTFVDIPSLLGYYKIYPLEKSCLLKPVPKETLFRVIAKYRFDGERVTDLPFERGELLNVIEKPEEGWWLARNSLNNTGLIPVPYVKIYEEGDELNFTHLNGSSSSSSMQRFSATSTASSSNSSNTRTSNEFEKVKILPRAPSWPAWVRVLADRYPSIYDADALPLKRGQLIYLLEILPSGMCRGISDAHGRIGLFPYTYVEWTDIPLDSGPWMLKALKL